MESLTTNVLPFLILPAFAAVLAGFVALRKHSDRERAQRLFDQLHLRQLDSVEEAEAAWARFVPVDRHVDGDVRFDRSVGPGSFRLRFERDFYPKKAWVRDHGGPGVVAMFNLTVTEDIRTARIHKATKSNDHRAVVVRLRKSVGTRMLLRPDVSSMSPETARKLESVILSDTASTDARIQDNLLWYWYEVHEGDSCDEQLQNVRLRALLWALRVRVSGSWKLHDDAAAEIAQLEDLIPPTKRLRNIHWIAVQDDILVLMVPATLLGTGMSDDLAEIAQHISAY